MHAFTCELKNNRLHRSFDFFLLHMIWILFILLKISIWICTTCLVNMKNLRIYFIFYIFWKFFSTSFYCRRNHSYAFRLRFTCELTNIRLYSDYDFFFEIWFVYYYFTLLKIYIWICLIGMWARKIYEYTLFFTFLVESFRGFICIFHAFHLWTDKHSNIL